MTLAAWLDDWLEVQRTRLQPSTWASYRGNVDRYSLPALGRRRVDELTPAELTAVYARLLRAGGYCGKPLSVRTDPDARDHDAPEFKVWAPEQTRTFLAHVADDPHREVWELAIATGMRRGELLGLRWDDVEVGRALLHVRRARSAVDGVVRLKRTKTNRSRSLFVDELALAALQRRRQAQQRRAAAARQRRANRWNLVFTTEAGEPLDPGRVTHAFARAVRAAPSRASACTTLRHLHATQMQMPPACPSRSSASASATRPRR